MSRLLTLILLSGTLLLTSACGKVLMWTFGIRNPREYSEKDILKEARKQRIPQNEVYVLDTLVNKVMRNADTAKNVRIMLKNHSQPAQALYYDRDGNLISFHITCYAHGYRSKWNHFGSFNQFPPETAAPSDTLFSFEDQVKYLQSLDGTIPALLQDADYSIFVYFNRVLRARNRRLIKEVQKNLKLQGDLKTQVFYVNTDNYWFYSFGSDAVEF